MIDSPRSSSTWIIPIVVAALALVYIIRQLSPAPQPNGFHIAGFAAIPVVDQGRIKPLDTLARVGLMIISNKQSFATDDGKIPAVQWALDVMVNQEKSRSLPVFRVDHPEIIGLLGLDKDEKLFSYNDIMNRRAELATQITRASEVPAKQRTVFQRKLLDLSRKVNTYVGLENIGELFLAPPMTAGGEWKTLIDSHHDQEQHSTVNPAGDLFVEILKAWQAQDAPAFNDAVARYHAMLDRQIPQTVPPVRFEGLFNRFSPFVVAMVFCVLALVLALLSWLGVHPTLQGARRAAVCLIALSFLVHTFGLVARIYIQGRPPVTNLYSSAIFVGWGCVILGMVMELLMRNGVGTVTAAVTGFLSLLVAHNLAGDGDTMTMMQAVLDTNFWLATHVVVITLGYAATFFAGFLAILYIFAGIFTPALRGESGKALTRMIYGIICFATLFSFVGTILGGIWADQSWGRFWGWDPKENGALLIVLWNALVLHARWGGMAQARGIAVLAVFGNVVTAWSWFGTNMLGVGLHSYGFMDSALLWMLVFVATQLFIMAVGMIPLRHWASFSKPTAKDDSIPQPHPI